MNRRELIKILRENGYTLCRSAGGHDIYSNGTVNIPLKRSGVNETTARYILKEAGIPFRKK
mgnify:CR=1 FL=1